MVPSYPELWFNFYHYLPKDCLGQVKIAEYDPKVLKRFSQLHELAEVEIFRVQPVLPKKLKKKIWLIQKLNFWRSFKKSLETDPHPDAPTAVQEVEEKIQATLKEFNSLDKPKSPRWQYKKRFDASEIKKSADMLRIINQHVELKRRGKEYIGKCPFHSDRRPSFSVNPQKGLWHCFACQIGGSVIDFVMKLKNCTFSEAVEELAND